MAKRKKLTDLVEHETDKDPAQQQKSQTNKVPKSGVYRVPESGTYRVTKFPTPTKLPKYLTLVRKEARIREDQLDQLTVLARKLNRAKKGGERITENTLIRVAVDLLLAQDNKLKGATEAQLLDSINLDHSPD